MNTKPYMARVEPPRYTPHQEQRAKKQMARIEAWLEQHQQSHELRLRALLKPQLDCWR